MKPPARGMPIRETELGIERKCSVCREWWPLDAEFFTRQPNGYQGFHGQCKACKELFRNRPTRRRYVSRWASERPRIKAMLALGRRPEEIAAVVGCSPRTVYRERAA